MLTSKQTPDLSDSLINAPRHFAYSCYGYRPQTQFMPATGFNGQFIEVLSGHYQLGSYRTYNTRIMRFHSSDSASPFGRGGFNAYAYCSGDPINYQDPSGHGPVSLVKSLFKTNKTIMQRREKALSAVETNPALKAYQSIAENSIIKKELKTLSDTGKALNAFTTLMEDSLINIDNQGHLRYNMIDEFEIARFHILEGEVMVNEKTLDSLLPAYSPPKKPELDTSATSLPLSTKNKVTRVQK